MSPKEFIHLANATYPKARHLLKPFWRDLNISLNEPSVGFCYIAAEAAYHVLEHDLKPHVATYFENNYRCTHWWLQKGEVIIDPTIKQFTSFGENPPYDIGRPMGFLTKLPSKRTVKFVELMRLKIPK